MASLFTGQQEQQWEHIIFKKKGVCGPTTSKSAQLNAQRRVGNIRTQRKMGKCNTSAVAMSGRVGGEQNMCKLEEGGEETFRHAKVGNKLRVAIAQARTANGMTQKQLATSLNVRVGMIADYESGRAIPNPQFLVRIEQKLNCKLRSKKCGDGTVKTKGKAEKKAKKKKNTIVDLLKGLRISK